MERFRDWKQNCTDVAGGQGQGQGQEQVFMETKSTETLGPILPGDIWHNLSNI